MRMLAHIATQQARILRRLEGPSHEPDQAALLSPAELAKRLGRSPQWVREHSEQLGGIRDGDGPKPRYWFDLGRARERLAALASRRGRRY